MKKFDYTITDEVGIHARPAGLLVKEAKKFASVVLVSREEKSADAKKLMALMGLGAKKGDTVTVSAEGSDEAEAIESLEKFFRQNL